MSSGEVISFVACIESVRALTAYVERLVAAVAYVDPLRVETANVATQVSLEVEL